MTVQRNKKSCLENSDFLNFKPKIRFGPKTDLQSLQKFSLKVCVGRQKVGEKLIAKFNRKNVAVFQKRRSIKLAGPSVGQVHLASKVMGSKRALW